MRRFVVVSAALAGTLIVTVPAAGQDSSPVWSAEGRLEDSDAEDDARRRYDDHRVRLEAGRRYRISTSSDDFDTVIRLMREGAEAPLAENDDFGGSFNSRITYAPETAGDYVVRVLAYSSEGRGAYSVEAQSLPPLPPAQPVTAESPFRAEGSLASAAQGEAAEAPYAEHRLRLEGGRRYRLSAESEAFDTLLRLVREEDESVIAENDDSAGGLNSRTSYAPEQDQTVSLRVLSVSGEGGAYSVLAEELPPLPPPIASPASGQSTTRWSLWEGELTEADPDREGQYFDDYLLRVRAGETRLIMVDAQGFDPMVQVLTAAGRNGEPIEIDDDSAPGFNSLLAFQAEEDGDYIVRVTSFGSGSDGGYRLRISDPVTPPLSGDLPMTDEPSGD